MRVLVFCKTRIQKKSGITFHKMEWTKYKVFLALMLIVTGSINSTSIKLVDRLESEGSDGQIRNFNHPFLLTAAMFLGETLCLLIFKALYFYMRNNPRGHPLLNGNHNFNPFMLLPAAFYGLIATSIMYVGLTLTFVSSFQLLRGSIIVFVAMLSTLFLRRNITLREWVGIFMIIVGLLMVGTMDAISLTSVEQKSRNKLITGDMLIIFAQFMSACQMVYEEKYVTRLNMSPLQAVGWEGLFGFWMLSLLLVVFYWIPPPTLFGDNARGTIEDAIDGLTQIVHNRTLLLAVLGTIVSIAFSSFAGISVTMEMSATTRMVLDSFRIFVIWMISLALSWQVFHLVQLIGFVILILGMWEYTSGIVPQYMNGPDELPQMLDANQVVVNALDVDENE